MSHWSVAALQPTLSAGDNREHLTQQAEIAVARFPWLQMLVFPELASFGPGVARAEPMPGDTEQRYCALAKKLGVWLIPGSIYEAADGEIFNTAPVINSDGQVVTRARKLFPFLPYESGVTAGAEHCVFDVPEVGRMGLSICYDMWFPETTRNLVAMGAEVIFHPTLTNTMDRDLECSIARSSAGINQCYFVDVNAAGSLGYGRSSIVGPEGDVIQEAGTAACLMPLELDLARVRRVRERGMMGLGQTLKSFRDRRCDFPAYQEKSEALDSLGELKPWGRMD